MSTLLLKSPYIRAHTMPKDKKGQKKVQMLKKTTVLCHSMSYITVCTYVAGVGRVLCPSMSYYSI